MGPFRLAGALCLVSSVAAQGSVLVVDDDGGPGVGFTDLPAAVAAASDGDVLVVRDGSYSGFTLEAKGLAVFADTGAAPAIDGTVVVRNLGASQRAVLRGLATGLVPVASGAGIVVEGNAGPVRIEDCTFVGADGNQYLVSPGANGAYVEQSSDVSFARCVLTAGDGADVSDVLVGAQGPGGVGLLVLASNVVVTGTVVTGGEGGSDSSGFALSGSFGGAGARFVSGLTVASASTFNGGRGGSGGSAWEWKGCGSGGAGGAGAQLLGGELATVDVTLVGGPGGFGIAAYGCPNGPPGAGLVQTGGTLTPLAGPAAGFTMTAPLRPSTPAAVTVEAVEGELAVVAFAFDTGFDYVPLWSNVLLLAGPLAALPLSTVQPGGTLSVTFGYAGLPPGVQSVLVHGQAAIAGSTGPARLTPASTTVLLGAGY